MKKLFSEQRITETLETNYMPYAMSVIISRAIPEIDGFKPSHRKLLYTMYKMGLLKSGRTKSANVVGQTMKLNPHGDMAIYETLVRLTRGNAALLLPLVDSKGNFGKQYSRDMAFAAPRYTEVKLEPVCEEVFRDIEKNAVDFTDNYDGTMKEPLLLPCAFPNILANPNQGIAVGMASTICSFNLAELCAATISLIKDENADISKIMPAPDFSTGGELVLEKSKMDEIYATGRGSFRLRARWRYDKAAGVVEIYEIPYSTTIEAIMDKLAELVKQGKAREINDVRDETDISGLKITIDLKKGVNVQKLMARLFAQTPLESSFSCNFNILVDERPKTLGVSEILKEWIEFRTGCIKRQTAFDIDEKNKRLHLLRGLQKILLDIDKAIAIIKETREEALVVPNLMEGFLIDKIQAEYVADIKLRNLNREYILKRTAEINALDAEIRRLGEILKSEREIKKIISRQLEEISKKYAAPRRSEIVLGDDVPRYCEEEYIEDYNLRVFLTEGGYFKKIPLVSLRAASEQKLREGDKITAEFETSNRAEIIMLSNQQNAYKMKLSDIGDTKASALGDYLPNLLELSGDERIVYIIPTEDYSGQVLFFFENGKAAKVGLGVYETKLNRRKLTGAYYAGSPLVGVRFIAQDADMVIYSSTGKVLVFSSADISEKATRTTQGVQVLNCKRGARAVRAGFADEAGFLNAQSYRARNLPAAGYYLKEADRGNEQLEIL